MGAHKSCAGWLAWKPGVCVGVCVCSVLTVIYTILLLEQVNERTIGTDKLKIFTKVSQEIIRLFSCIYHIIYIKPLVLE